MAGQKSHDIVFQALRKSYRLGYSDHNSLYARLWRDANPMLVPAISHLFWEQFTRRSKKLKTCTVRNALKLRHGTLWNVKLASHLQKPYLGKASDGRCPLCRNHRNSDSGTHVLGACTHRLVEGLYIERHNEAVATAGKAIMEGPKAAAWQCC